MRLSNPFQHGRYVKDGASFFCSPSHSTVLARIVSQLLSVLSEYGLDSVSEQVKASLLSLSRKDPFYQGEEKSTITLSVEGMEAIAQQPACYQALKTVLAWLDKLSELPRNEEMVLHLDGEQLQFRSLRDVNSLLQSVLGAVESPRSMTDLTV